MQVFAFLFVKNSKNRDKLKVLIEHYPNHSLFLGKKIKQKNTTTSLHYLADLFLSERKQSKLMTMVILIVYKHTCVYVWRSIPVGLKICFLLDV